MLKFMIQLSINDNIKLLENIKQGFRRTVSWKKYRSKITTHTQKDYLIDQTFRNINGLIMILQEVLLINTTCHL